MEASNVLDNKKEIVNLKEHKFFDRILDNDLSNLSNELIDRYHKIEQAKIIGVSKVGDNEYWASSNSVSTMKWQQYNVFQFHIPEIYNLYLSISEMVKEACDYYEIDFNEQKFMLQGWFNINETKRDKILRGVSELSFISMYPNIIVNLCDKKEILFSINEYAEIYKFIVLNHNEIEKHPKSKEENKYILRKLLLKMEK